MVLAEAVEGAEEVQKILSKPRKCIPELVHDPFPLLPSCHRPSSKFIGKLFYYNENPHSVARVLKCQIVDFRSKNANIL